MMLQCTPTHTPNRARFGEAPWSPSMSLGFPVIIDAAGNRIASMVCPQEVRSTPAGTSAIATATSIAAAAPVLLVALESLVAQHDNPHGFDDNHWYAPMLAVARDAIARARVEHDPSIPTRGPVTAAQDAMMREAAEAFLAQHPAIAAARIYVADGMVADAFRHDCIFRGTIAEFLKDHRVPVLDLEVLGTLSATLQRAVGNPVSGACFWTIALDLDAGRIFNEDARANASGRPVTP